jgi:hypothetical protein
LTFALPLTTRSNRLPPINSAKVTCRPLAPRTETTPFATTSDSTGAPSFGDASSSSAARASAAAWRSCRTAALHRLAADRRTLIDRAIAVALHPRDPLERDVQFLGDNLSQRGRDACAKLHFSAEHRHRSIGSDGQPRIHLIRRRR